MHSPPTTLDGTDVKALDDPIDFDGESWLTLVPTDPDDERLWEFSITTGRIIQTA